MNAANAVDTDRFPAQALIPLHFVRNGVCSCHKGANCTSTGKHPMNSRWTTQSPEERLAALADARETYGTPNIGLVTGPESGVFVLDIDPDNDGDTKLEQLEAQYEPLEETYTVKTGSGGMHYYYKLPEGVKITNSRGSLPVGIDIRGQGGMVVIPPSVSGKGSYEVRRDVDPIDAPQWLLDLITKKNSPKKPVRSTLSPDVDVSSSDAYRRYALKAMKNECEAIINAPDGDQNNTINRAAFSLGGLVPHGLLSEEEIFDELMGAAQEGNHPAGRAASTISSGLRAGMEQPRELPDLEESSTDWDFSEDLLRIIKKSDTVKGESCRQWVRYRVEWMRALRGIEKGVRYAAPLIVEDLDDIFLMALAGHNIDMEEVLNLAVKLSSPEEIESRAARLRDVNFPSGLINCSGYDCGPDHEGQEDTVIEVFSMNYRTHTDPTGTYVVPKTGMFRNRAQYKVDDQKIGNALKADLDRLGFNVKMKDIREAQCLLSGQNLFGVTNDSMPLRSARYRDGYLIDLANEKGEFVYVSKSGWEIVEPTDDMPVFRVSRGALPTPQRGGSIDALRDHLSFSPDSQEWMIIRPWLATAFMSDAQRQILLFTGNSGAGKTTRAKHLLQLIDPSPQLDGPFEGDERDLMARAMSRYLLSSDNISHISKSLSDALCRMVTGYSYNGRELFTSTGSVQVDLLKTGILTGISVPLGLKEDALDRVAHIRLGNVRSEPLDQVNRRFEENRGLYLGAVLDDMVRVLREMDSVDAGKDRYVEMSKAARIFGAEYLMSRERQAFEDIAERAEGDMMTAIVATVIHEVSKRTGRETVEMTYSHLLDLLEAFSFERRFHEWMPSNPRALQSRLDSNIKSLEAYGVKMGEARRTKKSRLRPFTYVESSRVLDLPEVKDSAVVLFQKIKEIFPEARDKN